jgi:hypothetical protein
MRSGLVPLAKPAQNTRQYHTERISEAWQKSVEAIIETGRRVLAAKEGPNKLPHGEFLKMVNEDLPFGEDAAEQLMAIAAHPVISNSEHVRNLPPSWGTLYQLTRLPAPVLEAKIADGTINPGMERKDVAALKREPAPPGPSGGELWPKLSTHANCVRVERLAEGWDDHALSNAICRIMMAAVAAVDAPRQDDDDPADAASNTIMELERWAVILKKGKPQRNG